jgi:hypothetical protein
LLQGGICPVYFSREAELSLGFLQKETFFNISVFQGS